MQKSTLLLARQLLKMILFLSSFDFIRDIKMDLYKTGRHHIYQKVFNIHEHLLTRFQFMDCLLALLT